MKRALFQLFNMVGALSYSGPVQWPLLFSTFSSRHFLKFPIKDYWKHSVVFFAAQWSHSKLAHLLFQICNNHFPG